MNIYNRCFLMMATLLVVIASFSCKKYLDVKPNIDLSTIGSLQDLQSLLNYVAVMNQLDPEMGEVECDDYFVSYTNYKTRSVNDQDLYIWDPSVIVDEWSFPYEAVYRANIVLDNINNFYTSNPDSLLEYNSIKGQALFFRGLTFYQLAQIYAPPLNTTTQNEPLGICLRLSSSITNASTRSTVQQTYDQIIQDLSLATQLLPVASDYPTTPNRAAAYGALARVYLVIQDYTNAEKYADSCLSLHNTLIDYNSLSTTASYPFTLFNAEDIYHSEYESTAIIDYTRSRVDSSLQRSYAYNDLRDSIFFQEQSDGYFSFKGDYTGNDGGYPEYDGIATDEIYLIKAECEARNGDVSDAMTDLNTLMVKRYNNKVPYTPYTATNSSNAVDIILTERRKELVFRNLRWADLKRLNQDPSLAITLTRNLNGTIYTLPPGDLRYEALIPASVISLAGMQQNPR